LPFSDLASKITEAQDKIEAIKKDIRVQLEADIKTIFDEMIAKYPGFMGFSFAAYTPYFNDGDPCVFHYHGYDFAVRKDFVPEDEELYGENWIAHYEFDDEDVIWESGETYWRAPEHKGREWDDFVADLVAIDKMLGSSEEFIQLIWGDHVCVTITRDGVSVDEYDHD